jgi:hypothetical protein
MLQSRADTADAVGCRAAGLVEQPRALSRRGRISPNEFVGVFSVGLAAEILVESDLVHLDRGALAGFISGRHLIKRLVSLAHVLLGLEEG